MINTFIQILKNVYFWYFQTILFIAGFVVINIAIYLINAVAGLFLTGITLILFGIIMNHDRQRR